MKDAIYRLFDAWSDLKKDGWREIIYAPKDGTEIEVIEAGSTGIHKAAWVSFEHDPCGCFFVDEDWPCHPILFRTQHPGPSE